MTKEEHGALLYAIGELAREFRIVEHAVKLFESWDVEKLTDAQYAEYQQQSARAHRALRLLQATQREYIDADLE